MRWTLRILAALALVAGLGFLACGLLPERLAVNAPIMNSLLGWSSEPPPPEAFGGRIRVAKGYAVSLYAAVPRARFATPEGKLGIIPGGGATARLPRIVGRGWGMEMLLMGEPVDAERALPMGLVTRIVEPDQLIPEARRMAEHLAGFAPFVPRTMKAMVHFGMEASLAGALMFEKYAQGALVQTDDKVEGITAFLEKRKPEFPGK